MNKEDFDLAVSDAVKTVIPVLEHAICEVLNGATVYRFDILEADCPSQQVKVSCFIMREPATGILDHICAGVEEVAGHMRVTQKGATLT